MSKQVMWNALNALCLPCSRWNKTQTLIIDAAIKELRAAIDAAPPDTEPLRKELDDALKDRVALAMELERVKGERDALSKAISTPSNLTSKDDL